MRKRGKMLDPQKARRVLKEYYATATDEEIVEDLWRDSPELARRLGVAPPAPRRDTREVPARRGMRGQFAAFRQSVLKLFA